MSKRYGVGIIGAGSVAVEYVKAFRDHPLTWVVGMHSRTRGKAASLMREQDVDGHEYDTLDDLFADDHIAIVVSCTHGNLRREHCVRAAETGRHIVIEKPVGLKECQ